jgi:hypothetical protein
MPPGRTPALPLNPLSLSLSLSPSKRVRERGAVHLKFRFMGRVAEGGRGDGNDHLRELAS